MVANNFKTGLFFLLMLFVLPPSLFPQDISPNREEIIQLTSVWKGDRFSDGRPKVSDNILKRMKEIPIETAWQILKIEGYPNQYEGNWINIHPGDVLVGRALTAQYMPLRKDVREKLESNGKREGRIGDMVTWPIEQLVNDDVYVADSYGKVEDGPIIGSNLGTSILSKSGNGVVFNGTVRDINDLNQMKGFTSFIRGYHPSYQQEMMLTGINVPIRIGGVYVLPGDIVLGCQYGVIFIPPHLAERIVKIGELVKVRDEFGQLRIKEGKYTSGQIDNRWTSAIEKDFSKWYNDRTIKLPFPEDEFADLLKDRTW